MLKWMYFFEPGVFKCVDASHTLVDHYQSVDSTVVAALLFWVSGETGVFPFIFKCDVPQQDGDVVGLRGSDELHALMIDDDPGLHTLDRNHPLA